MNTDKAAVLLVSSSTRIPDKKKLFLFSVLAGLLIAHTVDCAVRSGIGEKFFISLFLAVCSIAYLRFRKFIYVSEEGFVKDTETFFAKSHEVLSWGEIDGVTLISKGDKVMAVIEKPDEMSGWKLYFKKEDKPRLKAILKEHLAVQRINDMGI